MMAMPVLPRPSFAEPDFRPVKDVEDKQGQADADQSKSDAPRSGRHAYGGRHPDARRGGQSLDLMQFAEFQYGPGAEKTDPRRDALNDAAYVIDIHPRFQRDQCKKSRADGNEHMSPNTRCLALM